MKIILLYLFVKKELPEYLNKIYSYEDDNFALEDGKSYNYYLKLTNDPLISKEKQVNDSATKLLRHFDKFVRYRRRRP